MRSLALLVTAAVALAQTQVSIDDRDPAIQYTPTDQWTVHTNQPQNFSLWDNSDTFSSTQGANITYHFNGSFIQYWGNTGPFHGHCEVFIDDESHGMYTTHATDVGDPIMIAQFDNLDPTITEHTIVITVSDPSFPNTCELDRFVIEPTTADNTPGGTSGGTSGGSSNNAAIIGGAVGGGVVAALLVIFVICVIRHRKHAELGAEVERRVPSREPKPAPYTYEPLVMPYAHQRTPSAPSAPSSPDPRLSAYSASLPVSATPLLAPGWPTTPLASQSHPQPWQPAPQPQPQPQPSTTQPQPQPAVDLQPTPVPLSKADEARDVLSADMPQGASASSSSGPRPLVQHADAGPVQEPLPEAAEELPPAYNEGWQAGKGS